MAPFFSKSAFEKSTKKKKKNYLFFRQFVKNNN